MKYNLIFSFAMFGSSLMYAQTTFPVECTDYLKTFAQTFATTNLATPCVQWTGDCRRSNDIYREGSVMIGAHSLADSKLSVTEGIISTSLRVIDGRWPDYVFYKNYDLMSLSEVKTFIAKHKHLPNTPSEAEVVAEGGFKVGSVLNNHQEKIEEAFLHLISLKAQATQLNEELAALSKEETTLLVLFIDKLSERSVTHLEK